MSGPYARSGSREREPISLALKIYLGLAAFGLIGSLASKSLGVQPGFIGPLVTVAMIIAGLWTISNLMHRALGAPTARALFFQVLAIGLCAELIGLYTGLPFGRYEYTQAWWPVIPLPFGKWLPLLLPLSWIMLSAACLLVTRRLVHGIGAAIAAGLLAALVDLPMEWTLAERFAFWTWLDRGPLPGGASWLNPVGWFLTAGAAGFLMEKRLESEDLPAREALILLAAHTAFIVLLGVIGPPK